MSINALKAALEGLGPDDAGVKAFDRAALRQVKRLALRYAFDNVKQDDIAQFLDGCEMGERAADLACADKRDLGAGHGIPPRAE